MSRVPLRHPLAALLLLGVGLRLAATWQASVAHPDELFQYLEQAHRLVFGYGLVPWEYRDGMRSWLVPGLLAGPMWLGARLAPASDAYLLLPRLAVALATLGAVWGAWSLGARVSRLHAALGGFVAATWLDGVYFAGHTLTETIATAAAIPGVALLFRAAPEHDLAHGRAGRGALLHAGALLAFAALVRFHYAPPLALLVAWRCRLDARAWGAVTAGAAPVLALSALVDIAAGMRPYAWVFANYRRNVVENASATYGVSGPLFYLGALREWWGLTFLPLVFLAFFGAQRFAALLVAAGVLIGLHMTIGHKELRFILLAMTLLALLAAFGTAELVRLAARHRVRWAALAFGGWAAAALAVAFTGEMRFRWSSEAPALAVSRLAGRDPALCGFATYDQRYWEFGGYAVLHRDVPVYPLTASDETHYPAMTPETLRRITPAFDALATTAAGEAVVPGGYRRVACVVPAAPFAAAAERAARRVCLYRRPGGCDPAAAAAWRLR